MRRTNLDSKWIRRRLHASAALLHLAGLAFIAPMLVLCDDGVSHATVEVASSRCCGSPPPAPDEVGLSSQVGSGGPGGCADRCVDTPFFTSFEASSVRGSTLSHAVAAGTLGAAPSDFGTAASRSVRLRHAFAAIPPDRVQPPTVLRI